MFKKQKLLFSTKISQNTGSDMIGGSIAQILLADFYQSVFGYQVTLHDPFFNVDNILDHKFNQILNIISDINDFDRVANCQFYFGNNYYKNKIKIDIERNDLLNKFLPIKEKDIITYRDHEMYSKQENIHYKFLDMPYIYQYDLMYKLKYRPSFKPVKSIFETKKDVYGIHIRQRHWKNIKSRSENDVINFYVNIFEKIKSNNGLIIYYGSFNSELEDRVRKYNAINGNEFSEYPLERALLLSRVNYSISSINGFSLFANYLAIANNNLKNISIINDLEKISEINHLRRVYAKGWGEGNVGKTGVHSKFRIYPGHTLLNVDGNFSKNDFEDFQENKQINPRLIYFRADDLERFVMSKKIDNILIEVVYSDALNRGVTAQYFNSNDILGTDLYVLTHYSLDIKKDKILGRDSLDFNKPKAIDNIRNIGPDQLVYENILDFLYRAKLKLSQPSQRVEKVAFITGYKMNDSKENNLIKIFNSAFRFTLMDERITKAYKYFKRKIFNLWVGDDLNPLNLHTNIFSKFNIYSAEEIEYCDVTSMRKMVDMILANHDRVICEPSRVNLLFSAFDRCNKLILFTERFKDYDLPKSTFSDVPIYKISDFFPIHFQGISELRVHLKNLNIRF